MSSDDQHQLDDSDFGLQGIEKSQGFEPMTMGNPAPSGDDLPTDAIMSEDELRHFKRPEPPQPDERDYFDNQTGEPTPPNKTVDARQAAFDLHSAREQEAKALENEAREALSKALDGEQPDQPQAEQSPELDVQPEALPADSSAQDAEVERLLQNPALRERVAAELQQHSAVAEYARSHYAQAAQALAEQTQALTLTTFPELAPFVNNPQQMAGALKMLQEQNPSRYAELQLFTQKAGIIQEHAARAAQEQQQAVQQRQQEEFQRYAQAEDAKAFSRTPPEELRQIREYLYEEGKKAGFSREQINQHWGNNVALRNSHVSELIADGVRYRMAIGSLRSQRNNPIQKVQRPGVSESVGSSDNSEYAALERQYRGRDLTMKQAADLLSARRARG